MLIKIKEGIFAKNPAWQITTYKASGYIIKIINMEGVLDINVEGTHNISEQPSICVADNKAYMLMPNNIYFPIEKRDMLLQYMNEAFYVISELNNLLKGQ